VIQQGGFPKKGDAAIGNIGSLAFSASGKGFLCQTYIPKTNLFLHAAVS
jgi:hypothetical protein